MYVLTRSASLSSDGGTTTPEYVPVPIAGLAAIRGGGFLHARHLEELRRRARAAGRGCGGRIRRGLLRHGVSAVTDERRVGRADVPGSL